MENTDRLCDWFELHHIFQVVCGSIKEKIEKNNFKHFNLENNARQIIHIINTHSD